MSVADSRSAELYLFGTDGATYKQVAGVGDGPGEFRAISSMSVTAADTVYVFDRRHVRITVLDPDGALVRTVPVDPDMAAEGNSPQRAWHSGRDGVVVESTSPLAVEGDPRGVIRDQRDAVLFPLSEDGSVRGSTARFQGGYTVRTMIGERGIIIVSPFANVPIVGVGTDRAVYGSGIQYDLTISSADLTPSTIIRWPGWNRPLTDALLDSVRAQALSRFGESFPEQAESIVDAMLDEELLPSTLPALGSALVDDAGRIWVAAFQPSMNRSDQANVWHVLSPQGDPLARVRIPDRSRIMAVRADEIAVSVRDELEVEHLQVLSLRRPEEP